MILILNDYISDELCTFNFQSPLIKKTNPLINPLSTVTVDDPVSVNK